MTKCVLLRGGGWFSHPVDCRSAFRGSSHPSNSGHLIGFRVVCAAPSKPIERAPLRTDGGARL